MDEIHVLGRKMWIFLFWRHVSRQVRNLIDLTWDDVSLLPVRRITALLANNFDGHVTPHWPTASAKFACQWSTVPASANHSLFIRRRVGRRQATKKCVSKPSSDPEEGTPIFVWPTWQAAGLLCMSACRLKSNRLAHLQTPTFGAVHFATPSATVPLSCTSIWAHHPPKNGPLALLTGHNKKEKHSFGKRRQCHSAKKLVTDGLNYTTLPVNNQTSSWLH